MKFVTISTIALALLSTSAEATVFLGTQGNWIIAWINGDNSCTQSVAISKKSENPCGRRFKLSNGFTYSLTGCGGSNFAVLNGDGSFNALCRPQKEWYVSCLDYNLGRAYGNWAC